MRTILSLALLSAFATTANAAPLAVSADAGSFPMVVARNGADDPAGHVRGGRGADNAAGDVRHGRGTDNGTTLRSTGTTAPAAGIRRGSGADNPPGDIRGGQGADNLPGDVRRGRGKDDPVGHG